MKTIKNILLLLSLLWGGLVMHGSASSTAESSPPPSSNNNNNVVAAAAADAYPFSPMAMDTRHFPPHFFFGTGTSAYQIEGAHNKSGKGPSIFDTFFHESPERTNDGSNGDLAVDFYNKYEEDIERMSELGMNAFRFSISWPRVIPSGRISEGVNEEGIAFYNRVINETIAKGMEPFVTIFHYDVPQALEDKYGGFLSDRIVSDYKDFAELCFQQFGDRVKYWTTFNEPYQFSMNGWEAGRAAPGRCSFWVDRACPAGDSSTEPYIIAHNLLLAHAHAVNLYRTKYQDLADSTPKGKIGITLDVTWSEPLSDGYEDVEAALRNLDFTFGWFMDPMTYGQYPRRMRMLVPKRLPEFTWDQKQMLKNSYDFVGLNSYTSTYVHANFTPDPNPYHIRVLHDPRVNLTQYKDGIPMGEQVTPSWLFVYPKGIFEILKYTKDTYKNPIIYITENGLGDSVDLSPEDAIKDTWRISYLRDHLYNVRRAICEENVRVEGYFVWTSIDNLEWQSGYAVRMGLYSVDRSTEELTRTPKWSALWFRDFLTKNGSSSGDGGIIPDPCKRRIPLLRNEIDEDQQQPSAVAPAAYSKVAAHDEL